MAYRGYVNSIRILGIDANLTDRPRVVKPNVRPGLSGIRRFVNSVALRDVRTQTGLAHSDVDYVRVRFRNPDPPHRTSFEVAIGNRRPSDSGVRGFPHAAASRPLIVDLRLACDARNRRRASTAERSN